MKNIIKKDTIIQQWVFQVQRRPYSRIKDEHKLIFIRRKERSLTNQPLYKVHHSINGSDWKVIYFTCYSGGWRYINRLKNKGL